MVERRAVLAVYRPPASRGREQSVDELAIAIRQEAERLGYALDEESSSALHAYHRLLERWGSRLRLTGSTDPVELVRRHLGDALALDALLELHAPPLARCIDVGSGGGLPALPLLSLRVRAAGWHLLLVEANQRKAAFLRTALHELGFSPRTEVVAQRLERWVAAVDDASSSSPCLCDVAWSLATFAPTEWLERAQRLLRPGGLALVFVAREERLDGMPADFREIDRRSWSLEQGAPRLLLCYRRQGPLA